MATRTWALWLPLSAALLGVLGPLISNLLLILEARLEHLAMIVEALHVGLFWRAHGPHVRVGVAGAKDVGSHWVQ